MLDPAVLDRGNRHDQCRYQNEREGARRGREQKPCNIEIGQGEFPDRLGRKRIYQLSVLLYSLATIAAALAPNPLWLAFGRLIAGIGKIVSQAIAIVLVTPLNFLGNKLWSFRRKR